MLDQFSNIILPSGPFHTITDITVLERVYNESSLSVSLACVS